MIEIDMIVEKLCQPLGFLLPGIILYLSHFFSISGPLCPSLAM